MLLVLGKNEPVDKEVSGDTFQVYSYPYADIYTYNGVVQFWVLKEVVYEGAEEKAVEAYKKAAELDPKLLEKAVQGITYVGDLLGIEANAEYNLGNHEKAADIYLESFNVKKDPLVGKIDSVSIYNAGNIYFFAQKYDRAIEILQNAVDNNVWEEGRTPYLLGFAYMQTKQYDKAKDIIEKGLKLFPDNKELIESMVSYYAETEGDFNEIRDLMEQALKNDPENVSIWNGLGQMYLESGDIDKTIDFYTRYVDKFPDSAQANFYLADALYEKGNKLLSDADNDKTMSKASKDAAVEQAKETYRKAWKYFDASYQIDPSQVATVQRLMFVSYRIVDDPGMEDAFNKFEAEYKAMTEGGE